MANELIGFQGKAVIGTDTVASLKDWKLTINGAELDASAFGDGWKQMLVGMRDWSATSSGSFVISSDVDGQSALQEALIGAAPTLVSLKLYVDATHYYTGDAYVKKIGVDNTSTDLVKIDFEFIGTGSLTFV
jgi:predicted secreted protein